MNFYFIAFRKPAVFILNLTICLPLTVFGANPETGRRSLSDDQKIVHVLNRLGFGARPGDIERVRAMGIREYIERQLNAASIDDSALEAKVKRLEVFNMSTAEIFAKYPNPGALLRRLEGTARGQTQPAETKPGTTGGQAVPEQPSDADRRERRRKLQALYREYDLRPAAQIDPQIVANRVLRAVYSERQLQEVMVDFWQNHFNVYARKAAVRWYIPSYERDVLRKNALGNFKDLVVGTAQHPAMLFFLDNYQSVSPKAAPTADDGNGGPLRRALRNGTLNDRQRERIKNRLGITDAELDRRIARQGNAVQGNRMRRGLNENYARELMELHTLGVDGGYTQKDIIEVSKAFSGWTIADPRGYRRAAAEMIQARGERRTSGRPRLGGLPEGIESGEFFFNDRWHDNGTKNVLGHTIKDGGIKDGLKVIDILVEHPSTARYIARKLAVKFVSDKPNEALIERVASAFQRSKGDIRSTLRALFSDVEFFAPENYRAKIKTPFELAISSVRALGGETNANPAFASMLVKLGEVPYGFQAPTGYPDTAEDWVNTGALLERMNFAVAIASNRIPGTRVNLQAFGGRDRTKILDKAIAEILNGEITESTRSTLRTQLQRPLPEVTAGTDDTEAMSADDNVQDGGPRNRRMILLPPTGDPDVFKAVSLVLGSPEFQRQ